MSLFGAIERLMAMDETVWARHANPWSVWTRFTCLPFLSLAIWSRVWIGWWALLLLALAAFWTWYNPRAFAPPRRTDAWASKATFGERVYLDRRTVPIPRHHERAAAILSGVSMLGLAVLSYGLADLHVWATFLGLIVSMGAKLWFVDRMVWLYDEMRPRHPPYAEWLRPSP